MSKKPLAGLKNIDLHQVATLGRVGYVKEAPGTVASVLTAIALYPVFWLVPQPLHILVVIAVVGIAALVLLLSWPSGDHKEIVIDEVAGQAIACFFVPTTIVWFIVAVVLFRIFDIAKPGPIKKLEAVRPMWLGIFIDDVAAGLVAGVIGLGLYWASALVF